MSSVRADYGHIRKVVEAAPPVRWPADGQLKWYNIYREQAAIAGEVQQEARDFLCGEVTSGRLPIASELGFVILHRTGDAFLLLVCTWRYDNELWETVYLSDGAGFELLPKDELHKPTYCVWEMGAVLHEQQAWIRYLFSVRDEKAQQIYLTDQVSRVLV